MPLDAAAETRNHHLTITRGSAPAGRDERAGGSQRLNKLVESELGVLDRAMSSSHLEAIPRTFIGHMRELFCR